MARRGVCLGKLRAARGRLWSVEFRPRTIPTARQDASSERVHEPHSGLSSVDPQAFDVRTFTGISGKVEPPRAITSLYVNTARGLTNFRPGSTSHAPWEQGLMYCSRTARRYLDRRFPDRWISRGGSIAWPPRSPDLNPLDFYLWGHLKSLVYSSPVPDLESLRNRIVACSEDIRNTPGVWDRVRRSMRHRCEVCIQARGGHFEHLL
ncbi:hypothetical protein ANN_24385 [Periplaneta americana]|uniref:Uncharacterized protein n=1 Tax=Periplaneta americana TaxID=6978 RepID=A0ABQ8S2X6_PERAM|nr:hypothetical protein ANN_24385 [Periplaneta americana]